MQRDGARGLDIPLDRHRPRRRATQYSAALRFDPQPEWLLGSPPSRGMTIEILFRDRVVAGDFDCVAETRFPGSVLNHMRDSFRPIAEAIEPAIELTEEDAMKILTTAVLATVLMSGSALADSQSTKCWADAGFGMGYWVKCDGASQYT